MNNYYLCFLFACLLFTSCKPKMPAADLQKRSDSITLPPVNTNNSIRYSPPEDVKGIPTDIKEIRKAYSYLITQREHGRLDAVSFKYSCAENNGTIIYFYEEGKLRMIDYDYSEGDHSGGAEQYFIKDSTLFFVFTESGSWSFEENAQTTVDWIKEVRTYIVNQQPIKCLEKSYEIHSAVQTETASENIANKEVDCPSYQSLIEPYQMLIRYRNNPTTACPEKYAD